MQYCSVRFLWYFSASFATLFNGCVCCFCTGSVFFFIERERESQASKLLKNRVYLFIFFFLHMFSLFSLNFFRYCERNEINISKKKNSSSYSMWKEKYFHYMQMYLNVFIFILSVGGDDTRRVIKLILNSLRKTGP